MPLLRFSLDQVHEGFDSDRADVEIAVGRQDHAVDAAFMNACLAMA